MSEPELLDGKYRVLECIGSGASAAVFAGVHVRTEREIAIKRFAGTLEPMLLARFEREARAAGRIRSRYVVDVLDVGHDKHGIPFIVMERLHGESLASLLRREQTLDPERAARITRQVLLGIIDAHNAGVIHRDLKPSNVFLVADAAEDRVKIVDFGISKIHDDDRQELTRDGVTLGTFSYMPPEQIRRSASVGASADLWSIGVILYRMLAGHNPFRAESSLALLARILEHPPDPIELDADTAASLRPVIMKALEKDPARRYQTAEQMLADLDAVTTLPSGSSGTTPIAFVKPATKQSHSAPLRAVLAIVAFGAGWLLYGLVGVKPAAPVAVEVDPADAVVVREASSVQIERDTFAARDVELPPRPGASLVVVLAKLPPVVRSEPAVTAAPTPVPAVHTPHRRPVTKPSRAVTRDGSSTHPPVIRSAPY